MTYYTYDAEKSFVTPSGSDTWLSETRARYRMTAPQVESRFEYAVALQDSSAVLRRVAERNNKVNRLLNAGRPLPYFHQKAWVVKSAVVGGGNPPDLYISAAAGRGGYVTSRSGLSDEAGDAVDLAEAAARSRLISKIRRGESAAIGETLAEWKQAHTSLDKSIRFLSDLSRALLAVRRGSPRTLVNFIRGLPDPRDWAQARVDAPLTRMPNRNHLRLDPRWQRVRKSWRRDRENFFRDLEHGRSVVKDTDVLFAQVYLEVQLGLGAVVRTAYDAAAIRSLPVYGECHATATSYHSKRYPDSDRGVDVSDQVDAKVRVRVGGRFALTNHTMYSLAQCGVANPIATAWDLVPLSFVFDWWWNLGRYLEQFSDFYGLKIEDAYRTVYTVARGSARSLAYIPSSVPPVLWVVETQSFSVLRTLGLPGPTLPRFQLRGLGLGKSVTAISLAVAMGRSALDARSPLNWKEF